MLLQRSYRRAGVNRPRELGEEPLVKVLSTALGRYAVVARFVRLDRGRWLMVVLLLLL